MIKYWADTNHSIRNEKSWKDSSQFNGRLRNGSKKMSHTMRKDKILMSRERRRAENMKKHKNIIIYDYAVVLLLLLLKLNSATSPCPLGSAGSPPFKESTGEGENRFGDATTKQDKTTQLHSCIPTARTPKVGIRLNQW